ncbi:MAG TPA: NADH-quinone oxidoreductase subunit A [Acidimicrobiia bacterium]|nr:NADH-quinone oxidoreductase subunit A [Acidimicrobiia bacterium]
MSAPLILNSGSAYLVRAAGFTQVRALSNLDHGMQLVDYLPIAVMLFLAGGFVVVSLVLSRMVSPNNPTPEKLAPYECGILPEVEPVQRFPVKFYLVAMLFVIFDVEIIFLFAWASRYPDLGWYGVGAVGIFTFFVLETLAYVWKRGALDWYTPPQAQPTAAREELAA